MRAVVVIVACGAACSSANRDQPGACLPLEGAQRRSLIADPLGDGLYWLEAEGIRDFDGEVAIHWNLVRFDLRTRRHEVIAPYIGSPLVPHGDGLLALRFDGTARIARFGRDGTVEDLTPDDLDVVDYEPMDHGNLAFLADGNGPRAAYTLNLDRPKPKYLVDADTLLSAFGGHVFTVTKDNEGIAIDPLTRATARFKPTKHYWPLATDLLEVEDSQVVAHGMLDGRARTKLSRKGAWRFIYRPGAILARTAPHDSLSEAFLLTPGFVTALPAVIGGASLLDVTELDGDRWALVGHNTAHYLGDLVDTGSEADVCLLPRSGSVAFPTRDVPKRYEPKAAELFAASHREAPGSTLQLFDGDDTPVILDIRVKERAGSDVSLMRETARKLHHRVTSVLGDREIKTRVTFLDERTAVQRWRRSRLRERTFVGMGDALMADPSELAVELRDRSATMENGKITCSGTVANIQSTKLAGLSIHCIDGDRGRTIPVPDLAPGATFSFEQTYDVDADAHPHVEVYSAHDPVEFLDTVYETRMRQIFDLATSVYGQTGFALFGHDAGKTITVTVHSPPTFTTLTQAERVRFATMAYNAYAALREIYASPPGTALLLKIIVQTQPVSYEFDGSTLTTFD